MSITDLLATFTTTPLFEATTALLSHLGVAISSQTQAPIPFLTFYRKAAAAAGTTIPQAVEALFERVSATYFIGTVNDETVAGNCDEVNLAVEAAKPHYTGMFVFAIEMKPGELLKRSEAAILVRGINRVVRQNPATVFLREGEHLSVATCERTPYKQTWRPGEKVGKVSILKGIHCHAPHRGHLDILESMKINPKKCKTFDDLYAQWQAVFSSSLLTKQFYREIQNWYFWALQSEQHVAFPNDPDNRALDAKYNAENLIRLITRLIFTWFMKEKGLVNPDLFEPDFLSYALKYFNPEGSITDPSNKEADKACTYYRAILQNLFFATFNQEILSRGFVSKQVCDKKHYNIKTYYRNANLFKEHDEAKIIGYFNASPFVNGGLFECLDAVEQLGEDGKKHTYSWDGFSNHIRTKTGALKSALIPDHLFFGTETTVDLSDSLSNKRASRSTKVRGIINILKDYVFTIEENTPLDEDVALDPELLGKVFENLLGAYNPETQQMARNATGSFYTPREIVNYMVKASLKAYLQRTCPEVDPAELETLLTGHALLDTLPSIQTNAETIITALFNAKILDPACGSGAFPMGIMSTMVDLLRTVDPENRHWHKIVLHQSLAEASSVAEECDSQERAELRKQIEADFNAREKHPDYARKLYLIEHCIFGSDIQPIAVQISRLRFFITLLCEQPKNDDANGNYGITPLPNLENNFVAANSLLSIDLADIRKHLNQDEVLHLIGQLRDTRHQLFLPKTSDKKKRLREKDECLRGKIAKAVEGLYDKSIADQCARYEQAIASYTEKLERLTPADFQDELQQIEETDLLGEKTVQIIRIKSKGKTLQEQCDCLRKALTDTKNSSNKERLLTNVKRLIAWNPFAFNTAETFLDPQWMFDVKAGFDIVIGNPPYIQLQSNHGELGKLYQSCGYETFTKTGDLYCLFYERGSQLLKPHGHLCYITSNKWMRAGYGEATRKFFAEKTDPQLLIDFAGEKIFESATVDTNILLFEKGRANQGKTMCCIGTPECRKELSVFVQRTATPCAFTADTAWVILSPIEQSIKRKIEAVGTPLKEWDIHINYGIKTGCNEAFIIDESKRTEILANCKDAAERTRTEQIIRPILRGRDIKRYGYQWAGLYLIATHNGIPEKGIKRIDINNYPALKVHLDTYWEQIASRADKGDTPYNLRSCAYMDDFAKPKIVWAETMRIHRNKASDFPRFALAFDKIYTDKTCFVGTGEAEKLKVVLGILNSKVGRYQLSSIVSKMDDGGWLMQKIYIENVLLPRLSKSQQQQIAHIVDNRQQGYSTNAIEHQLNCLLYTIYGLNATEIKLIETFSTIPLICRR